MKFHQDSEFTPKWCREVTGSWENMKVQPKTRQSVVLLIPETLFMFQMGVPYWSSLVELLCKFSKKKMNGDVKKPEFVPNSLWLSDLEESEISVPAVQTTI